MKKILLGILFAVLVFGISSIAFADLNSEYSIASGLKFYDGTQDIFWILPGSDGLRVGDDLPLYFGDDNDIYAKYSSSSDILEISGKTVNVVNTLKTNSVTIATTYMAIGKFGSVAAGTDDERPVFVAPYNCELTSVQLVNASAIATDDTNYTTISLVNKGSDGTANNTIASINNGGSGTAFSAFDAVSIGSLNATHKLLSTGDVVTLKKVDSGSGTATDEMIVMISYKPR